MYQNRHISRLYHAFIPALCISFLILPSTSLAGGLGDLFPRDIVDKIKSTNLKDLIHPSGKSENAAEPAPSQNHTTAAPAVAHKQQETKPVENTTKPAATVDPAVAKEAEEVKAWCYKNPKARIEHDCECVASRFIVERQAAPDEEQDVLFARITAGYQCPNLERIKAKEYKRCIEGVHQLDTNGVGDEAFCQCVGKQVAKSIAEETGRLASKNHYRGYAMMHCRQPEAYR